MGVFFGIGGGAAILQLGQSLAWSLCGERLIKRLRVAAYHSIIRNEIAWFDHPKNTVGRLTSRLAADCALIKSAVGDTLGTSIRALASLGAGLVIAFIASWRLSLVVLGCLPIMIGTISVATSMIKGSSAQALAGLSESGHVATESMTNIRTVTCLNLQGAMLERFRRSLDRPHAADLVKARMGPMGVSMSNAFTFGMQAVSFWAGAQFMANGWMSFQDLLQCFFGLGMSAAGVGNVGGLVADQAKIDGAKRSVFAIIDRISRIDATVLQNDTAGANNSDLAFSKQTSVPSVALGSDLSHPEETLSQLGSCRIEFRDVHFRYPGRSTKVLDGLSFVIEAGQTVAVVGPSGSGKSTIVALLLRFYERDAGTILIDGIEIESLPLDKLRSTFGWVQQEAPLFADTIAYNIGYGRAGPHKPAPLQGSESSTGAEEDVVQAATDACVVDFLPQLKDGFMTHVGDRGSQLSGGQKQRVAIARALVRNPRVLLLDEATSALDARSEAAVQESIDRLLAEGGHRRTTLVIAHRLATVQRADRILVLAAGRLAESGTHESLLARPHGLYRRLALAQDASLANTGAAVPM
eukprot:CAMPEP_0113675556 /NCGR_PEP_ID=MMETSP0038_2-20120614/8090_1 /TAXON_ID=2898 /ORGANISM="Cryptomonas paramecium" /LENGTH=580 /DNA_ID=CAMNT_0000592361 /DNA_START=309 /DNA_END=2051 /DNA_ORIENTATION=+ /assembly_acc=CAM_ASM_000170